MTPDDQDRQPDHRAYYEASGDDIEIRQPDDEDGVFEIRMPIVSTGEVRNENDEPFTRDELEGMAQQIGNGVVSVFPDHGKTAIGGPNRYSIAEKGGEWTDAEVVGEQDTDSGEAEMYATARLMDPDTLPDIPIREMLGTIKELVNRNMSVSSSIGWKEDASSPGGYDLMEASIVGIPADPRTTSDAEAAVVARAAVDAGANPDELVEAVRDAITRDMTDDDPDESAEEADDTTEQDEQPDEEREAPEWAERLVELQEEQMDTLEAIAESVRPKDEDDDEEEDEEDNASDEDEDEEEDDENAADEADEEQDAADEDARELAAEVESLREELDDLRAGGFDAEDVDTGAEPDEESSADEQPDDSDNHELTTKYGIES